MAEFKIKTKNNNEIGKKPRVYFCCHPNDFEKYFEKICGDILKTHDCAIYYTEDMNEIIAEDDKESDLRRHNLFVVPVTFKLLVEKNRAMDEDIPYAISKHIPVLPFMMEPGLDEIYSLPGKFGELQYLNPYSYDVTEISYEEKLKKHLEVILISDEMAKRVRAAFDAYIFLSYRKKDRKYANELMKLIHNIPNCRDIAIWFDEFLTPGENFKESIEKILKDSKLFTLLVTPNLLEMPNGKPNFVMGEEYPRAKGSGIEILPIEMVKTDRYELEKKYNDIPQCITPKCDEVLNHQFLKTIMKLATVENNTPEHNFLIGLAYLDGIDVEVNRKRGTELVVSAAEAGLVEAMEKLCEMYTHGIGTEINYSKAMFWAERILNYNVEKYGKKSVVTIDSMLSLSYVCYFSGNIERGVELGEECLKLLKYKFSLGNTRKILQKQILAGMYMLGRKYSDSEKMLKTFLKTYKFLCRKEGERSYTAVSFMVSVLHFYLTIGNYEECLSWGEKAYIISAEEFGAEDMLTIACLKYISKCCGNTVGKKKLKNEYLEWLDKTYNSFVKIHGENHPQELQIMTAYLDMLLAGKNYQKALEISQKAYEMSCDAWGENHPMTITILNSVGVSFCYLKEYKKALNTFDEVKELSSTSELKTNYSTLMTLYNIAVQYSYLGQKEKSLELHKQIYAERCEVLGELHYDTIESMIAIAYLNSELGNYQEALDLFQKSYALCQEKKMEYDSNVLTILYNIAYNYGNLGNHQKALEMFENVYVLFCEHIGEYHSDTLSALHNIAFQHRKLNNHKKALEVYEKYLGQLSNSKIEDKHKRVAIALEELSKEHRTLGNNQKSLEVLQTLYNLQCEYLGDDDVETIRILFECAKVYNASGEFNKSLELCEKVYECILSKCDEFDHKALAVMKYLAVLYTTVGNYQRSLEFNEKLYMFYCENFGDEHPYTLTYLHNLASVVGKSGDHQKAIELKKKVYMLRIKVLGEEDPKTLESLYNLAYSNCIVGENRIAMELLERLYMLCCKVHGKEASETLRALKNLAVLYEQMGENHKALDVLAQLYELYCEKYGAAHQDTIKVLNAFVEIGKKIKKNNIKNTNLQNLLEVYIMVFEKERRVLSEDHSGFRATLNNLAFIYKMLERFNESLDVFKKLYDIQCKVLGEDHLDTIRTLRNIEELRSKIQP